MKFESYKQEVITAETSINGVSLNHKTKTIRVLGENYRLSPIEYEILNKLMSHPGRIFSREELMDAVATSYVVNDRTIDSHIKRIRSKIFSSDEEAGKTFIKTRNGIGYSIPDLRKKD